MIWRCVTRGTTYRCDEGGRDTAERSRARSTAINGEYWVCSDGVQVCLEGVERRAGKPEFGRLGGDEMPCNSSLNPGGRAQAPRRLERYRTLAIPSAPTTMCRYLRHLTNFWCLVWQSSPTHDVVTASSSQSRRDQPSSHVTRVLILPTNEIRY